MFQRIFSKKLLAAGIAASLSGAAGAASSLDESLISAVSQALGETEAVSAQYFTFLSSFKVYNNLAADEAMDSETVAEIVSVSKDGNTLIYTDSEMKRIGFVDITNPTLPSGRGFFSFAGEPTSVSVAGNYALVGVDTSDSFTDPSGFLAVIDISDAVNPLLVRAIDLKGQPDSVDVSPDGYYAAVAIENERDEEACVTPDGTQLAQAYGEDNEDLCNDLGGEMGALPQAPAGNLAVLNLMGEPAGWTLSSVDLTGLADVAGGDPEPEYVDINVDNLAVVSLQENNYMVVVDLPSAMVVSHFSAGSVTLEGVDDDKNKLLDPVMTIENVVREPDAVAWVYDTWIATANEGDWNGGSRGFTLFDWMGNVAYDSGTAIEDLARVSGHYPEKRAGKKGTEIEGIASGCFGDDELIFAGAERGNFVAVYRADLDNAPTYLQILPTGVGPEGILPIPQRDLLVVASEKDDADEGFRSFISIYQYGADAPAYPQITSDANIGWGALSGLAADPVNTNTLYTVHDSFYEQSRIYQVDIAATPANINDQIVLMKDGETVNYDLEGIFARPGGGFWAVSEGKVRKTNNLLLDISASGKVQNEIMLPEAVRANQVKYGFEGVTAVGSGGSEKVYVAVQHEWGDDPDGYVKIGEYTPVTGSWQFFYYPLDAAEKGWVGLSEIVAESADTFLVLERDNQQGPNAAIKRVYRINLASAVT
ncbi:MAG: esterase-like activity of phytase family protein, partial [Chromatiales bacterium]|nr:esterase-like activity of phytase family protein [Chromatiales bacterium]